jgi:hypothetical protein
MERQRPSGPDRSDERGRSNHPGRDLYAHGVQGLCGSASSGRAKVRHPFRVLKRGDGRVKCPACGELMQTEKSDTRLDEIEAAP